MITNPLVKNNITVGSRVQIYSSVVVLLTLCSLKKKGVGGIKLNQIKL